MHSGGLHPYFMRDHIRSYTWFGARPGCFDLSRLVRKLLELRLRRTSRARGRQKLHVFMSFADDNSSRPLCRDCERLRAKLRLRRTVGLADSSTPPFSLLG